ncbi:hypothetical protein Hanom_Chr06g00550781 [Helianthus anomalus]
MWNFSMIVRYVDNEAVYLINRMMIMNVIMFSSWKLAENLVCITLSILIPEAALYENMSSLASITRVAELSHDNSGVTERDHRAYVSLFRAITAFQLNYCVASPVSALSTGDYPEESIKNTMVVKKSIISWGYYWSSLFELDFPTCSSGDVRFQMGHPKSWKELNCDFIAAQECADDKFIWTYTSPIYLCHK